MDGHGRDAAGRSWQELVSAQVAGDRAGRDPALRGQEDLVGRVEALLFDEDPIGIDFGTNTDEYRPEARVIVARLAEARSEQDVAAIIHETFVRWFDPQLAGPVDRYRSIASVIWGLSTNDPATTVEHVVSESK